MPTEDVQDVAGTPTTTPTRTALDLTRWSARHVGLAAIDALTHAGLVEPEDLRARLATVAGQRFAAQARELVALCEPATESAGESWLRLRLVDAGLPRPVMQVSLRSGARTERYRLDTGYEEWRIAAEYDGEEFHGRTFQQARDDETRRQEISTCFAWTVIGFTSANLLGARPAVERVAADLIGWTRPIRRRRW